MREVSTRIEEIVRNTGAIRKLHKEILCDAVPDQEKHQRCDDLAAENVSLAKSARKALRAEQDRNDDLNESESRIRKTQVSAQAQRLAQAWAEYNNEQVSFYEENKALLVRKCRVAGIQLTEEELNSRLEETGGQESCTFTGDILRQTALERRKVHELESRHRQLLSLEKSLAEVQAMFMDIAALVEDQGDVVNSIEAQIQEASGNVERGKEEVKEAHRYKRKIRKRKVYLSLALGAVVVGIVILLVLFI